MKQIIRENKLKSSSDSKTSFWFNPIKILAVENLKTGNWVKQTGTSFTGNKIMSTV